MYTPEEAAQAQLDAYNARNINAFADVYADDVQLLTLKTGEAFCTSKKELRLRYAPMFERCTELHCHLVSRTICGNIVIDEECVTGQTDVEIHAVAIYEVINGLICRAWFVRE